MKKIVFISAIFFYLLQTIQTTPVSGQSVIQAQTGYYTNDSVYNWMEEWYKLDGTLMSYWFCPGWYTTSGALKIAVFDSVSCNPWISPYLGSTGFGTYGEFHCQPYNTAAFDFYFSTQADMDTVRYFLDHIPPNDYVLVMTHQSNHCSQWDTSLIHAFNSIGSSITAANRIQDSVPYILFGKKGSAPGSAHEVIGDLSGSLILLTDTLPCTYFSLPDNMPEKRFSIFPNPASVSIRVIADQGARIEIIDLNGQIHKTIFASGSETIIDLAGIPRGVYEIKISTDNDIFVKKIIIE
jgi:hypothetical protein